MRPLQLPRGKRDELSTRAGKTFGVIGAGDIGMACARLAKAFGMRVIALRRKPQTDAERAEGMLDALHGPGELLQLVAESDYVVMSTPLTDSTHKLFGAESVAAMKPTGVFINVGRGKCVDEPALVAALQAGARRGLGQGSGVRAA